MKLFSKLAVARLLLQLSESANTLSTVLHFFMKMYHMWLTAVQRNAIGVGQVLDFEIWLKQVTNVKSLCLNETSFGLGPRGHVFESHACIKFGMGKLGLTTKLH